MVVGAHQSFQFFRQKTWFLGHNRVLPSHRNSWTLDARVGRWTLDARLWTLDSGPWTLDTGFWTLDAGLWTLDSGRFT